MSRYTLSDDLFVDGGNITFINGSQTIETQ